MLLGLIREEGPNLQPDSVRPATEQGLLGRGDVIEIAIIVLEVQCPIPQESRIVYGLFAPLAFRQNITLQRINAARLKNKISLLGRAVIPRWLLNVLVLAELVVLVMGELTGPLEKPSQHLSGPRGNSDHKAQMGGPRGIQGRLKFDDPIQLLGHQSIINKGFRLIRFTSI